MGGTLQDRCLAALTFTQIGLVKLLHIMLDLFMLA